MRRFKLSLLCIWEAKARLAVIQIDLSRRVEAQNIDESKFFTESPVA